MIIIDKADWQIDGGIPAEVVVNHFNIVFNWLNKHNMLTEDGQEELEEGIDESVSLNEELVTKEGINFLESCYDDFLKAIAKEFYGDANENEILESIYQGYLSS